MAMVALAGAAMAGGIGASGQTAGQAVEHAAAFGSANPFYAASTLPYHAPPFDKIKDTDYQPALEAGMAEQIKEVEAIANNPAAPTFENTLVALEKSGQLYTRVAEVFDAVTQANSNPTLEKVDEIESPKRAAHQDAIFLNERLFARVAAIHGRMDSLGLDVESRRLVDVYYKMFVHLGANLSAEDKAKLKKLNEEESTLENSFRTKLLAATKEAAYSTKDKSALKGLTDAEVAAAVEAAKERKVEGYVLPLQNTTQQPILVSLEDRATRQAIFEDSWNRAERGGANDTRETIVRLAQLRAEKAKLLGYANFADWNLEDQMAKTPEAAVKFMDDLVPASTAKAVAESKDIQAVIDAQKGGFQLQPWDWEFYSEQVRKAKYDIDEAQVRPYFELNNVLQNGVFYAARG
jgi:peptidyl-dipeptidase Dcp